MIRNSFFPEIEKVTFTNQFNLLSFTLGSKLNFLADFIKSKEYEKGLKYFAKIKF